MATQTAIERAKALLLAHKQKAAESQQALADKFKQNLVIDIPKLDKLGWKVDNSLTWNSEQLDAINMGLSGKSFCLIGAAGTGKTSTLKGIIRSIVLNALAPAIPTGHGTKWLRDGKPGIVLCSFTNMAVRQIAKHFSSDITCVTIHKLLEFAPVKYTVLDDNGEEKTKVVFEPSRHKNNPLSAELKTIVVDESSMVGIDLFQLLLDAIPDINAVQFIFLGDLNQLPPVFGGPILGKKLMELPIVELKQVYRQALLSPIIQYAIMMKDGLDIPVKPERVTLDKLEHGKLTLAPWSQSLSWEDALTKGANFLKAAIKEKFLDPYQDIVLCPYNVNFGVVELNARLADWLGRERGAIVYEVIAGFNAHYFAVGDKVLCNKREAIITKIELNKAYNGDKIPTDPHKYIIDRWGGAKKRDADDAELDVQEDWDVDSFLESMTVDDLEGRVNSASHKISVKFIDGHLSADDQAKFEKEFPDLVETATLSSSREINDLIFGYCITVHKSQGSEWRRVIIMTHNSHVKMCSRELMYTAITRAREECFIICEPDRGVRLGTLAKAAKRPQIKGNTLAEKLQFLELQFEEEERIANKQAASGGKQQAKMTEESDEGEDE